MTNDRCKQPWLIEMAIEPESKADQERLAAALAELAAGDPAFGSSLDPESGQTILRVMDELQLDTKIRVLRDTCEIAFNAGSPQVSYRETITRPATVDYTYKWRRGVSGRFARVKIVCEPLPPAGGYKFENRDVDGSIPPEYSAAVEKELERVLDSGVLAGFPVVDLKVTLIDGACRVQDSSAFAFETAARAALREALHKGASILLEPVMNVEVATPEDCARLVVADLKARRGQIQDVSGGAAIVSAMVPLANLFGYAKTLGSMSAGRAALVMRFDHYAPVPLPKGDPPFRPAIGMRGGAWLLDVAPDAC